MDTINEIIQNLEDGNSKKIRANVRTALSEGVSYKEILKSMLNSMTSIGENFKKNIIFVPEVLIIGRAFNVALEEIRPLIVEDDYKLGTMIIGTVYGDHHDVGKNLIKVFMESANIKVIDLGINVSANQFVDAIIEYNPDILGMSALLTTTMVEMEKVITKIEEANLRNNLRVIIGGAPITENFAVNIGADYFAKDAYDAVQKVKTYLENK